MSDPTHSSSPADSEMPAVLTIAASETDGTTGIQADLKTFCALDAFGTSAITCIATQHPDGSRGMQPLAPDLVRAQIKAICDRFPVRVAKTGLLPTAALVRQVANDDLREGIPVLVVDPIIFAMDGTRLLDDEAVEALRDELLPHARVATPNLREAELLGGRAITSVADMRAVARELCERLDVGVVIKGGQLPGPLVVDVLYDEGEEFLFEAPRIAGTESHGAGCAFSAALAAFLAHRELLCDAVGKAKEFVRQSLLQARPVGDHRPLNFFWDEPLSTDT